MLIIVTPKNPLAVSESSMYALKARGQKAKYGKVTVTCPRCHNIIKVIRDENRIIVSCPCHYISQQEIVF